MNASRSLIVLDTNLIVSAFLSPQGTAAQALLIALDFFDIACSREVLAELLDVIKRDKFDKYSSKEARAEKLATYAQAVRIFEITEQVTDCQDPKDNKFLELALSSASKLIVSGDKRDLLVMNPYKDIEIISLRSFIDDYRKY